MPNDFSSVILDASEKAVKDKATEVVKDEIVFKSTVSELTSGGKVKTIRIPATTAGIEKEVLFAYGLSVPRASTDALEAAYGKSSSPVGELGSLPNRTGAYHLIPVTWPDSTTTVSVGSANQVRWFRFYLPSPIIVTFIYYEVVAVGGSGFSSVGIYNAAGTSQIVATAQGTGTGVIVGDVTNTHIASGFYIAAFAADSASTTFRAATLGSNVVGVLNFNISQMGTAATAAADGVVPGSLGTLSAATLTGFPLIKLQE